MPHLHRLAELEPQSPLPWLFLSQCAEKVGRKQEAAQYARRATTASPAMAAAWMQLAKAENAAGHGGATIGFTYINMNNAAAALPQLERAAAHAPKDFLIQSQLGYCLLVTGKTQAAVDHLTRGTSLNPRYGPAWEHLGLAYQKQARDAEAVKAFERATQLIANSAMPWQHLADAYRRMGRDADAERAAARARQLGAKGVARAKRS